jgi:hypothetical protein
MARQFEIHELVEIGAAGHEGYILSHAVPIERSGREASPPKKRTPATGRIASISNRIMIMKSGDPLRQAKY